MEQEQAKPKSHTKMYYADVGEVGIYENYNIIVKREIVDNLLEIARRHCSLQLEITKVRKKCKDVFGV